MAKVLTLHRGVALGRIPWGQVQSYCGDFTPQFYTREMGIRNLMLGAHDPEFHPWTEDMIRPLIRQVEESDLPRTFAEFANRTRELMAITDDRLSFWVEAAVLGQASGFIRINRLIRHFNPVLTLGMGIPMIQKMFDLRRISSEAAGIYVVHLMLAAGITENITDRYAQQFRGSEPRFAWETYHTLGVIEEIV